MVSTQKTALFDVTKGKPLAGSWPVVGSLCFALFLNMESPVKHQFQQQAANRRLTRGFLELKGESLFFCLEGGGRRLLSWSLG